MSGSAVTPRPPAATASAPAPTRVRPVPAAALLALGALTLAAFVLRVVGLDQSLFADEYFTHDIVAGNGLRGVWHEVFHTSITPPLHYGLAWLALQFGGDSTVLVRLPSLVFGTAIVPLVFVLGRRLGGVWTGLVAATLMALSPFAIWYSDEARTYATTMFLVALSTLALLRALDGEAARRWWVLYAASACAALWSHYTAVFVVVVEGAWALWARRDRARAVLLAEGAIVLGWLPWLPGFLEQRRNHIGIDIIDLFAPLSVKRAFEVPVQTLVGHPFFGLGDVPGTAGLALLAAVAVLIAVAIGRDPGAARRALPSPRSERGLVVALALATPVGLLLYAIGGTSLYLPRNLSASLPALALVAALVVVGALQALPRRVAPGAAVALAVLLALVTASALGDDERRPPYREAAHYLDDVADPRDPIVETPPPSSSDERIRRTTLDLYFRRSHPLFGSVGGDGAAWRALRAGRVVWTVAPTQLAPGRFERTLAGPARLPAGLPRRLERTGGPDGLALLRSEKVLPGIIPVAVRRYDRASEGRLEGRRISWTFGRDVTIAPGVARGAVEAVTPVGRALTISGWALTAGRPRLVDWVLVFLHDRLLAVSAGGLLKPEVAARFGPSALLSGFVVAPRDVPADRSSLRVFAVVGHRASELPLPRR